MEAKDWFSRRLFNMAYSPKDIATANAAFLFVGGGNKLITYFLPLPIQLSRMGRGGTALWLTKSGSPAFHLIITGYTNFLSILAWSLRA